VKLLQNGASHSHKPAYVVIVAVAAVFVPVVDVANVIVAVSVVVVVIVAVVIVVVVVRVVVVVSKLIFESLGGVRSRLLGTAWY